MTHKKNKINKAERRKQVLEQKKKRSKNLMIVLFVFIAVICLAVYFVTIQNPVNENNIKTVNTDQSQLIQTDTEIKIPMSSIDSDADFYTYDSDGVEISYFTVKGSDEKIHVAFDACDVCYNAKKGYRQNGDVMHCINCGKEYSINSLGTENTAGGCWPSYLPMNIDGDYVVIQISDLKNKINMF